MLLLVEEHSLIPETSQFIRRRSDWQVMRCLKRLGHEVHPVEYTNIESFLAVIEKAKPDVVFNLTDTANGDRRKDANLCALLELLKIPYTGAGPRGLILARDKALSKVVAERAGFTVPRFVVVPKNVPLTVPGKLPFPMVIKPRFGDASEGISSAALVSTGQGFARRIKFLRSTGIQDIICEEYISGRELFVGVVHDRVVCPKEFVFDQKAKGAPRIATSSFKYDADYRKRWGIRAVVPTLDRRLLTRLSKLVHSASVALEIRDYGRFDLKLTPDEKWVFLEANPNTGLAPPGKNWMGTWDSVDYDAMIARIVRRAMARANGR